MYRFFKRLMDIVLSGIGIILLLPVFLIIIISIKLDSSGPVFFRQKRFKRNRKIFSILKFRTMKTDTPKDVPTHLLGDATSYITRVGRVLRQTSLDELPQLFNIFIGDMSIIGPRPALYNQLDLMDERDKYGANDIRPGLTGWAQINGRDELPIDVKAAYDGEYVKNLGFMFDLKCFFKTIVKVLKRSGIKEGSKKEAKAK